MNDEGQGRGWGRYRRQAAWGGGLLLFGLLGMVILSRLERAPAQVVHGEKPLRVDAVRLEALDYPVALTGYGTVRPLRMVGIAAQVAGMVTSVHPKLRTGEVIPKGEVLFTIDDRDYQEAVVEASALAEQSRQAIERLEEELRRNGRRLETIRRNLDLTQREYDRVRDLFEQHQIGSQTDQDTAERVLNTARDAVAELENRLAVAPMLVAEAESARRAAEARVERTLRQVERCTVRSPFDARVMRSLVEEGQLVYASAEMVRLADDSVLELAVPLDTRDAYRWLQFQPGSGGDLAWFPEVEPVTCQVRWTEAPETHQWTGVLHRIEQLSIETRTLKVVIRVRGEQADNPLGFPLVEGMFCSVEIPGRDLHDVYEVPQWALSVDNTVYLSVAGRLVTRPVHVAHTHDEVALVDQGLQDGEILIVTRLSAPLENALLDLNLVGAEGGAK